MQFEHVVAGNFVEYIGGEPDGEEYTTCETGDCTNLAVAGNRHCHDCLQFLRSVPRLMS